DLANLPRPLADAYSGDTKKALWDNAARVVKDTFKRRATGTPSRARPSPKLDNEEKVGLALSGGGHRAAFFHIGVLARLAERDRLRGVRVISTVSGGSIVGALYYLHVKALLEAHPDDDLRPAHYKSAVHSVAHLYRAAV